MARAPTREPVASTRVRARAMTSSTGGREAVSTSIPRRYSCSDFPARAALLNPSAESAPVDRESALVHPESALIDTQTAPVSLDDDGVSQPPAAAGGLAFALVLAPAKGLALMFALVLTCCTSSSFHGCPPTAAGPHPEVDAEAAGSLLLCPNGTAFVLVPGGSSSLRPWYRPASPPFQPRARSRSVSLSFMPLL